MGWLARIFGLERRPSPTSVGAPPHRAQRPQKRGLLEAEQAAEVERYKNELRASALYYADRTKTQAEAIGARRYIWRPAGDSAVCPACARNNSKTFSWSKPPKIGHPGAHECENGEWCRCIAEQIIK